MRKLHQAINYPSVVSTLALVIATTGGAYAASTALPKHSVGSAQLKTGAVTTQKIKNGAVTGAKLATNAVTSAKVRNGSLTGADLAAGTIGSAQVAPGAVGTDQLSSGSVTGSKLADGIKTYNSGWSYATNFQQQTIDGSLVNTGDLTAPQITSTVISGASVQVYFTFNGSQYFQLPYTSYAGGKASTIGYVLSSGKITIERFTADNSGTIPLSTLLQYRYVITPSESGTNATSPAIAPRKARSSAN